MKRFIRNGENYTSIQENALTENECRFLRLPDIDGQWIMRQIARKGHVRTHFLHRAKGHDSIYDKEIPEK